MPARAAFYIDGFNLFHAIEDLEEPHLKWVDLWRVAMRLLGPDEELVRTVWCTAILTGEVQKMLRHRAYIKALESTGVICVEGHFARVDLQCQDCGFKWTRPTEKEGDVNVAIHLISDAHLDRYEVAYLVTADSDQSATAKMFRTLFPNRKLISVAPPERRHSKEILTHAHGNKNITAADLSMCLFPKVVLKQGAVICDRPEAYAPPVGWVNPTSQKIVLPKKALIKLD